MDSARRFRIVLDQHKDRIYTQAFFSLQSREDAEDVTQEAFVRLWKNFSEIDFDRVGGWLVRVTRNLCIDAIRRRQAENPHLSRHDPQALIETAPAKSEDPRVHLNDKEEMQLIQESIAQLEEPYKSAVILREIRNLSYEEIAKALKIPIGSVKVHLHRGRRMLRELLREEIVAHEV
jgi:RNA polymerase sigma-70 factor (ECF subfamily)